MIGRAAGPAGPIVATIVAATFLVLVGASFWGIGGRPAEIDFYHFWDAAAHVMAGDATAAYSARLSDAGMLSPLAYPPPFLLLIAPLGLLDFEAALAVWLALTGLIYLASARQPPRLALANPPAAHNAMFGQTGFLTAGLMLFAAQAVRRRPILAGAVFGCMVIKPHLALLVPVALAAGRHWRALGSATASAALLVLASAAMLGTDIFAAWLRAAALYGDWLAQGRWNWNLLASPYGLLRALGLGQSGALVLHGLGAAGAAALAWKAWRDDWPSRVAVLATAALLVPPYLFAYDAVLLIAPLGWLLARRPVLAVATWLLALLPLATKLLGASFVPSTIPLACLLALAAIALDERAGRFARRAVAR